MLYFAAAAIFVVVAIYFLRSGFVGLRQNGKRSNILRIVTGFLFCIAGIYFLYITYMSTAAYYFMAQPKAIP